MRNSVETHSLFIEPPPLNNTNFIQLGAGHFHGGCAPCHGAPGQRPGPITGVMLPEPPDLSYAVQTWAPRQLFWIVKHGLKYTGMPSWVVPEREDEIWAVVAFLKRLPELSAEQYNALALGDVRGVDLSVSEILRLGTIRTAIAACARCHGDTNRPPVSELVPKLAGQKQAYLEQALREYAMERRLSGIMQPVAVAPEKRDIVELAAYYARLSHTSGSPQPADSALMELGQRIATVGLPDDRIPPCLECHRETTAAMFPKLAGQYAPYITNQLQVLRQGLRDRTASGQMMTMLARRLSDSQIQAVAAYLGSPASLRYEPARDRRSSTIQ